MAVKRLLLTTVAAVLLAGWDAHAVITRHDLSDSNYVVSDADYPALVNLFEPSDCIGTLVHESYLLTVAHCAADLRNGQSLKVNGVFHTITEVIMHPKWRKKRDEFDIALVRFKKPVHGVTPLPIYRGTDELGSVITLVGRGDHATGLDGERRAKNDSKLRRATNIVSGVDDHFIEIFFEKPGEDGITDLEGVGASGDSGCPVFIDVDGVIYIAGLNSWGDGGKGIKVGQYGSRDYQTRVSRYLEWLDSEVDFPDPPKNYYATATGKTGPAFRSALHDIIDDHRVIKYSSNNPDTADALAKLDADPDNPNSVILIYSRRSETISNFGTTSGWNREHLWANSYGIDKRGPAYSDLHNLKPADASVNSARSNKIYDTSDIKDIRYQKPGHPEAKLTSEDTNSWEPPADVRGEIARAAFYMDVRYSGDKADENDLQLTNDLSAISSDTVFFGRLDTLLEWHIADPVDAAERTRNDLVYSAYQKNRNPFVDHPEWVVAIYGNPASKPCVLSQPTIDGESFRFDLKLTNSGRYRVLRSIDLINWSSVEEFETSSGNRQLKQQIFGPVCFFKVLQRPDGD